MTNENDTKDNEETEKRNRNILSGNNKKEAPFFFKTIWTKTEERSRHDTQKCHRRQVDLRERKISSYLKIPDDSRALKWIQEHLLINKGRWRANELSRAARI